MRRIFGEIKQIGNREFPMEGIRTIWVSTSNQDIHFLHGSNGPLIVKEYAEEESSLAQVEKKGDALCLCTNKQGRNISFAIAGRTEQARVEVYVPADFAGQIYGETASGDILIEGMWELENLQLKTASGDISMGNVKAEHFLIETSSGDIEVEGAWGDRQFFSTSGDLEIGGGRGFSSIRTTSGDIYAKGLNGGAKVETVSGDIEMSFEAVTGNGSVATTSGDISIKTATGVSYCLAAESVSGDIAVHMQDLQVQKQDAHSFVATAGKTIGEETAPVLHLSSLSGDIHIGD